MLLHFDREISLLSRLFEREFHAVGAKQQKPRSPNCLVRTRETSNLPKGEERNDARDGTAETGIMSEERYFGAIECMQK